MTKTLLEIQPMPFSRLTGLLAVLAAAPLFADPHAEQYQKDIQPLLAKYCYECHSNDKQKGDLNLQNFAAYEKITPAAETWHMIAERVVAYEMPPKKSPQPDYGEHERLRNWFQRLPKEKIDCNQLASDRNTSFYRGYVMSRRLNRHEYNNTIRDLIGLDLKLDALLPADGAGGEGFDSTGDTLFTSPILIEKYLAAADHVAQALFPDDPARLSPQALEARQRLIVKPAKGRPEREAAGATLKPLMRRAFRRPATDEDVNRYLQLFDRAFKRGDGYEKSLRLAIRGVLTSPHFLFLVEPEPAEGGVYRLGAFPLASRLSYFLWSSMPDEPLLELAENGRLLEDEIFRQQIHRMLADPRARALGENFAMQWLDMRPLGTSVRPDAKKFPEFNDNLAESMRQELIHLFNHVMRENRPLIELIDCDYTFIDERLARLYGIPDISGPQMRQIKLADRHRGGVLGMAGVHTLTSYPLRTSPVLRGKWVLENLMGAKVPPPPPGVPDLEETSQKLEHASLRQQLEAHRLKSECASCHDRMDPLGFGLENFDALGRWRDSDQGKPIDASGKLPSGESFTNAVELKQIMLKRKDQILRNLVRKMTGYAFGRELNKFDQCVIDQTLTALHKQDFNARIMIEQIAMSFPFHNRYAKKD